MTTMTAKVLLIDDDQGITSMLGRGLNKHGFEVMTTNSSFEGVRWVRMHGPHIVILDLMMPEMNGWQVCREIRTFSYVPIVVYSARNEPRTIASILDAGADKYLVKPVPLNTLALYLRNAVSRTV